MFFLKAHNFVKNQWIVTQIEIDLCFDVLYKHTKLEWNRSSLSKVIERTPNFYNGRTDARTDERTDARTGVTLNAPPPFFEWRGHKNAFNYQNLQILSEIL